MKTIILVRHGESLWNLSRNYTGWADIGLTQLGINQAKHAGIILAENNIKPEIIYTSNLVRCIYSSKLIKENLINLPPILNTWRLNEKHYGMLTGYVKDKKMYPNEDYFTVPPIVSKYPMIDNVMSSHSYRECSYFPYYGESFYMTKLRVMPVINEIKDSKNNCIMICSHKNTIRVIMQMLERMENKKILEIKVPNSEVLIYNMDDDLKKIFSKKIIK